MNRGYGLLAVGSAFVLGGGLVSAGASGASPSRVARTSITLINADGFQPVSEQVVAADTVVDTFTSADSTVKLIGRPGSTALISLVPASTDAPGTFQVTLSANRPKTESDARAYAESGRTVVGDLVALGMPRHEAERQFGDMETVDGRNPYLADTSRGAARETPRHASSSLSSATSTAASSTTPYDVLCADVNAHGGDPGGVGHQVGRRQRRVRLGPGQRSAGRLLHDGDGVDHRQGRHLHLGHCLPQHARRVDAQQHQERRAMERDRARHSMGGRGGSPGRP